MLPKYDELIKLNLIPWNFCGANPFKNGKLLQTTILISIICMFGLILLIFYDFGFKLEIITKVLHPCNCVIHVLIYWIMVMRKSEDIKLVINRCERYWDFHELKIEEECDKYLTILKNFVKFFYAYIGVVLIVLFLPICCGLDLCLSSYEPEFINYYVLAVLKDLTFILGACAAFGSYSFILVHLVLIIIQFKILNHKLKSIDYDAISSPQDENDCYKALMRYVDHHDFLLNCSEGVNDVYSATILEFFILLVLSTCGMMFIFKQNHENLKALLLSFVIIFSLIMEILCFYCLPSEILTHEAYNVLNSIYESNWYDCPSIRINKTLIMMMMRAQKPTEITAGKMMTVNLASFTKLYKMVLSFNTFLDNINKK